MMERLISALFLSGSLLVGCSGSGNDAGGEDPANVETTSKVAAQVSAPKPAPSSQPASSYESPNCPLPAKFKGYTAETWCKEKGYVNDSPFPYVNYCGVASKKAGDQETRFMVVYHNVCSTAPGSLGACSEVRCNAIKQEHGIK